MDEVKKKKKKLSLNHQMEIFTEKSFVVKRCKE